MIRFTTIFTAAYLIFSGSVFAQTTISTSPAIVEAMDGQKLNAVLTLPAGKVTAVALILQGSGNVGMDGDVSGPFLGTGYKGQPAKLSEQISASLAAVGVASLRYSKRGVDDPAQLANQKFPFLVDDAQAALKMLQNKFPDVKSVVIGFSEGGLVASLLASTAKMDALFLLAPSLRPIDEVFSYQFITWPVELLKNSLKQDSSGMISASAFSDKSVSVLPLMGQPWSVLDFNHDNQVSITDELIPGYQGFYSQVRGLLSTPQFSGWYGSLKALPAFPLYASSIKAPVINIYQGMDDAQVRWSWIVEDLNFFPVKPTLHLYPHLGHCFAPKDGSIGEVKTSGPYADSMLEQLKSDVQNLK